MKCSADLFQGRWQIVFNFVVMQSDEADAERFNQFLTYLVGFLLAFVN